MSFDQYAYDWDTKRRINRTKIIANEIRNTLERDKYDKVLEFGCGTGLISFNLIDMMSEITMIDTSLEMIKIVDKKKKFLDT